MTTVLSRGRGSVRQYKDHCLFNLSLYKDCKSCSLSHQICAPPPLMSSFFAINTPPPPPQLMSLDEGMYIIPSARLLRDSTGEVARGARSPLRCRFPLLSKSWSPRVSLARWRSCLASVLFVKCRQSWPVIPELLMWESHGRAVKLVTLV